MSTPTIDRTAQILLPFAEKEWISIPRAESILGTTVTTLYRIRALRGEDGKPLIDLVNYGDGKRKRIRYASVVSYCDYLRRRYHIPDRRPPLDHPMFRHRDEDILPFPLRDTIGVPQAISCSGYETGRPVLQLIEEGAFEAYQLLPLRGCPWRISRSSFAAWLERAGLRYSR